MLCAVSALYLQHFQKSKTVLKFILILKKLNKAKQNPLVACLLTRPMTTCTSLWLLRPWLASPSVPAYVILLTHDSFLCPPTWAFLSFLQHTHLTTAWGVACPQVPQGCFIFLHKCLLWSDVFLTTYLKAQILPSLLLHIPFPSLFLRNAYHLHPTHTQSNAHMCTYKYYIFFIFCLHPLEYELH